VTGFDWTPERPIWLGIGAVRLEGRCWGPPPSVAPTIVLLHEGLGSVSLWRNFPEALAQATGWGVFAYSRRGYGQSDPADLPRPIDYMTREAVDVLPVVLDRIGFRRGILVGHSDGASIAAIHAGTYADRRVRGIVLMAPHFFTEPEGLASIAAAKVTFEVTDLKDRMARHHRDPDNAFRGWNDAWLNPDFAAWNIEDSIPGIACPVLAIQGVDDQYGTMAQIDVLERTLTAPFTRLDLADCRHAPHLEQREKTLDAIVSFAKSAS
jgi:pimeloyl-ACP methyl ester carboxylesterase